MNPNAALSQSLLQQLARLGVREVCVAAGARNTPLLTTLLASTGVKLWNFFEERCAGFFALGRIMVDRAPVAVVTTSGTAAAELLPAVIEAHYQALPLIVITADRPSRFRGSGAPQAIEQVGLFGLYAAPTIELEAGADEPAWPIHSGSRPLHINVCFDEPLVGETDGIDFHASPAIAEPSAAASADDVARLKDFLSNHEGLIVLASGLHPSEAQRLSPALLQLGVPIVAEATANLPPSDLLVRGGERAITALAPQRVLRMGSVPSWRWWRDLEEHPHGIPVMHLSRAPFSGLSWQSSADVLPLETLAPGPAAARPTTTVQSCAAALSHTLASHPLSEPAWMQHLAHAVPPGSRIFLGNSLPIREWNLAGHSPAGTRVFANRGANGIDGIASTFYGMSVGGDESWLIIGDLSALYDLAAPWITSQLPRARRRLIIINNGGGKIFSRVSSLRALGTDARQIIENQHTLNFAPWAQLWQMPYRRATEPAHLHDLPEGDVMVEVIPDASQTDAFWTAWK